jgi:hypothetical protein
VSGGICATPLSYRDLEDPESAPRFRDSPRNGKTGAMVTNVFFFPNGNVACTDADGEQVQQWQAALFVDHLKRMRDAGAIRADTLVHASPNGSGVASDWMNGTGTIVIGSLKGPCMRSQSRAGKRHLSLRSIPRPAKSLMRGRSSFLTVSTSFHPAANPEASTFKKSDARNVCSCFVAICEG